MAEPELEPAQGKRGHRCAVIAAEGIIGVSIGVVLLVWLMHHFMPAPLSVKMTREFREYIPTVGPSDGILETATCTIPETFTQTDSAWLFNVLPLGTNVAEIRVPAIYRYHINLLDRWKFDTSGNVCIVSAPAFEPSLPPAIVTGSMEKSTSAGWLRFDADQSLDSLERGITAELEKRAGDAVHRNYVREASRQAVAEFVKSFLIKNDAWRRDGFHQVIVRFPDDPPEPGVKKPSVLMPTPPGAR